MTADTPLCGLEVAQYRWSMRPEESVPVVPHPVSTARSGTGVADSSDPGRAGAAPPARRVLVAASVGQFVEFYDLGIYGLSVVVIAGAFFPDGSSAAGVLSAFAIYGVAFVVRPIGGVFFGVIGDRVGRKAVLFVTLLTVGTSTALIAVLPTYEQIGLWAPLLLVLLRLIQGFSAGGEAVGAPSFVLEHAPSDKRARWVSIVIAMAAMPTLIAGLLILGISESMSNAQFESWGWRIPFLLAVPLSLIGLFIRRHTEESPAFQELLARRTSADPDRIAPLRRAVRGDRARLLQVFFVLGPSALGFYFLVGYFVTYLQTVAEFSRAESLLATAVALLSFSVLLILAGHLSDRWGRRPSLIAGAVLMIVVAWPAFWLVTSEELGAVMLGQVLLTVPLCLYGGASYTFFIEVFPTATRLTGAGIAYNLSAALIGGTAPFVGTLLVDRSGAATAPAFYLMAVTALALVAALAVQETRPRDLESTS
jgi:MHS family proline/betaine transporter-like MFS transporter